MTMEENLSQRISDLEKYIHDLEKDLIHDPLTGLRTKAFFEEESAVYLSAIFNIHNNKRQEWFGFKNLSILFFDIDYFKKINDTYGHAMGDVVLREVAQAISKSMREGDTVARWGGEEIVAMLLGANETDAKNKAEDIREKIENLKFDSHPDLKVTISIGVATATGAMMPEELVKHADKALYKAKESGRNKVVTFSEI
jgi:diguanylate cyclase (GGDEF)-like protein